MKRAQPLAFLACGLLFLCAPAHAQERARALELNAQALDRYRAGDLQGALPLLRDAWRLLPEETVIAENATRCALAVGDRYFAAQRFDQAVSAYHEAATYSPNDPQPALREGLALASALRDRDAVAVLESAVRAWPQIGDGHLLLARSLYRLGENARAITHWERTLALAPETPGVREALERARREEAVERDMVVDRGSTRFTIKYDGQADAALGARVLRTLDNAQHRVGAFLGRYPRSDIAVIVYPRKSFRSVTGAHGWVAALYDGKIRLPASGLANAPAGELERVLSHEYTHALIREVGGPAVPTWLHEGLAQVVEGRRAADARRFLSQRNAPNPARLTGGFASERDPQRAELLYSAACDLVHTLLGLGGAPLLSDALDRMGRGATADSALRGAYGRSLAELHADWVSRLDP